MWRNSDDRSSILGTSQKSAAAKSQESRRKETEPDFANLNMYRSIAQEVDRRFRRLLRYYTGAGGNNQEKSNIFDGFDANPGNRQ